MDWSFALLQAVQLSLQEQKYQAEVWGQVEYAHDMEHHEVSSRVSAAQVVLGILELWYFVIDLYYIIVDIIDFLFAVTGLRQ